MSDGELAEGVTLTDHHRVSGEQRHAHQSTGGDDGTGGAEQRQHDGSLLRLRPLAERHGSQRGRGTQRPVGSPTRSVRSES